MPESTLYAWSVATSFFKGFEFEHAFVTDFELTSSYPDPASLPKGAKFWYCWGDYYDAGKGLSNTAANGGVAAALVTPDVAPPEWGHGGPQYPQSGAIRYYGIDGVCHQLANQVLFASGSSTSEPPRVQKIGSYPFSSFFYTNYGLNDDGWKTLRERDAPHVKLPGDDFDAHFAKVLPHAGALERAEVAGIRAVAHAGLRGLSHLPGPSKDKWILLKGILYAAMEGLKLTLGKDDFAALFPSLGGKEVSTPEEAAHWVDEDQFHRCHGEGSSE